MQVLHYVRVGRPDAQPMRLGEQHLLLHQLLADLLRKEVQNHRIVRILRIPLLNLLARNLVDPLLGHHFAGGEEAAVPVGIDHRIRIGRGGALAGKAGDEVNHHRHGRGGDNDDEKSLGKAIVSLQEADHGLGVSLLLSTRKPEPPGPARGRQTGISPEFAFQIFALLDAQFSLGAIHLSL